MSHTLSTVAESIRRDGFIFGTRLLLRTLRSKNKSCLLGRELEPDNLINDAVKNMRVADFSDLGRIVAAWPKEFGRTGHVEYIRSKIATRFEKGYPCIISEMQGQIEGAVWCIPWNGVDKLQFGGKRQEAFEICNLFVTPQSRGRGLGQQLLTQALSLMASQGKKAAYSRILPERHASIALHLNSGFKLLGLVHSITRTGDDVMRLGRFSLSCNTHQTNLIWQICGIMSLLQTIGRRLKTGLT